MEEGVCKNCGNPLQDQKKNRKFCSHECYKEWCNHYMKTYLKEWRKKPKTKKRLAELARIRYATKPKYRNYIKDYYKRPEVKARLRQIAKSKRDMMKRILQDIGETRAGGKENDVTKNKRNNRKNRERRNTEE